MVVRPSAERPAEFAIGLLNRVFVDAGMPMRHQAVFGELPVLVAIGAEPGAAVVVKLIGKAHGDAVAGKGP